MRHTSLAALLLALCLPAISAASAYQWQDDQGVMHFTDDSDKIPERYLRRAKEIDSLRVEPKSAPSAAPAAVSKRVISAPAAPAAGAAPFDAAKVAKAAQQARLGTELKKLQEGLTAKREELELLQHKWTVSKGRNPSASEIKEYEKKRASGKATFNDNPYVNNTPFSSSARARSAYYKKLEEVRKDEERVRQLEQELQALNR